MRTDYHLHNHFSPDSGEQTAKIIERALELGMDEICITNHAETHEEETGLSRFELKEAVSRFRKIKKEIEGEQKKYSNIRLRFGVELEYAENRMQQLSQFIHSVPLDFILGSVHVVRGVVISSHLFANELYRNTSEDVAYKSYFNNLLKLVEWGDLDIVAHFDICKKYGHKFYGPFEPEKYEKEVRTILKKMKDRNIGIELNTGSMQKRCRELFPHPKIINWALEEGIVRYTIGSDAHNHKEIGRSFGDAFRIARSVGISHLTSYSRRQSFLYSPKSLNQEVTGLTSPEKCKVHE
jgi:histidinol-phosphatase (PHP family)